MSILLVLCIFNIFHGLRRGSSSSLQVPFTVSVLWLPSCLGFEHQPQPCIFHKPCYLYWAIWQDVAVFRNICLVLEQNLELGGPAGIGQEGSLPYCLDPAEKGPHGAEIGTQRGL